MDWARKTQNSIRRNNTIIRESIEYLLHIYAPTETAEDQQKYSFYTQLQSIIDVVHSHDLLIISGDMNVKIGRDNRYYEKVMGKYAIAARNNNGEGLCNICRNNEQVITGKQIDHTLVNRRFRNSIPDTRVLRSILDTRVLRLADFGSDHYLVCTIIKHQLKKRKQAQETQSKRFDTEKLKLPSYREKFYVPVTNKYNELENLLESDENTSSSEQICNNIEQVYIEAADVVLGERRRKDPAGVKGHGNLLMRELVYTVKG